MGWYSSSTFEDFYHKQATKDLTIRAKLLRERLFVVEDTGKIDSLVKDIGSGTNTRYTVIDNSGIVLGDSQEDPEKMENHADRPEVQKGLSGEVGTAVRFSQTLKKEMLYVGIPIYSDSLNGVIRASIPQTEIRQVLETIIYRVITAGLVIAILAGGLGWLVSQKLAKPLQEMRDMAERFASGDLDIRLAIPKNEEMGDLAESMNLMAKQLSERIEANLRQKREIEAILSSMAESLLAINAKEEVIKVNMAAEKLLGIKGEKVLGKSLAEVVRNTELQELARESLTHDIPIEKEIELYGQTEQQWKVSGSPLIDAHGENIGAMLVLNDVTRLRRLERLRRDFVANVSHELKTPITSLKGFIETLLEGAIENREDATRFLHIMAKQAERLSAIIEDLLALSRIEQEAEAGEIDLFDEPVLPVIKAAVELCRLKLQEKNLELELQCSEDIRARINSSMLEQALVNLIDNAIKYSPIHGRVTVSGTVENGEVLLSVRDEGCGIEASHFTRLFERFYCVDKARSRKLGGTGLGLAIVKHIAQAHGGAVTVTSELEQGSCFTFSLPSISE